MFVFLTLLELIKRNFESNLSIDSKLGQKEFMLIGCRSVYRTDLSGELFAIFTGRNEVLAKVIFLHLSVIHSVHRGEYLTRPDTPPPVPGTPPRDQAGTPPPGPGRYTPPLRWKQQTPEYGQRSAGMHPTGMHSSLQFFASRFLHHLGHFLILT